MDWGFIVVPVGISFAIAVFIGGIALAVSCENADQRAGMRACGEMCAPSKLVPEYENGGCECRVSR